ncbi:glutaredoxin 3 [Anthonomus grandis grandis]|uniref:glutaredoxin 3 n=1 Tax=Anthonomus grandis grandis TaxID=2921223 RepID=UPI0021650BE3|nr:glutaredoxin 3 [Anthonomus grandis grandis]
MPTLIKTQAAFDEAIKSPELSVIHFQADWADQCAQVNDVLDTLSKQTDYSDVKFFTCPAEELSEISLKYNIEAVPTVLLFRSGKKLDRVDGADAAKITEKVKEFKSNGGKGREDSLEDRLKALINKSKVMLFMKGDRNKPRCGFSRQIIEILQQAGISYETFDILEDEEVRQGLKSYSDWPTYPQLYVNGDLIGGLDIVKELSASGELVSALKG